MLQRIADKITFYYKKKVSTNKNGTTFVLTISVVSLLLIYIVSQKDIIANFDWRISFGTLFIAILAYIAGLWTIFFAWYAVIITLGAGKEIITHVSVFSKSIVARRIPLPIWFIGSRFYYYDSASAGKRQIAVASIIELFLTGYSGIFFLLLTIALNEKPLIKLVFIMISIILFLVLILKPQLLINIINWVLKKFNKNPLIIAIRSRDWLLWFCLYLAGWIFAGLSFYFCLNSITTIYGDVINILKISTSSGLIGYISMVLPAGFGLKELGAGFLLTEYLPFSIGLLVSFVSRILTTIIEILWALANDLLAKLITH